MIFLIFRSIHKLLVNYLHTNTNSMSPWIVFDEEEHIGEVKSQVKIWSMRRNIILF